MAPTTLEQPLVSGFKTLKDAVIYRWSGQTWKDDIETVGEIVHGRGGDVMREASKNKTRVAIGMIDTLLLGLTLAACANSNDVVAPKVIVGGGDTGPRTGEVLPVHVGIGYRGDIGVFGIGIEGFDSVPLTKNLAELPFVGLKFGQGEPNGQILVKDQISGILPGLNEAMVAYDNQGVEKSGLLSINNNLFVLTRVGEGANNTLAMFAPNYKTIKYNSDGSASMDAYMTTRDGNGKWRIEQISISITLKFDAEGKLISYIVPALNPSFQPTRETEQRADIIIPKNISFVSQELKVEATKTSIPTGTATATSTTTPTLVPTRTYVAPSSTPSPPQVTSTVVVERTATPKPTMGIEWHVTDGGNSEAIVSQSNLLTQTEISPFLDQIRARGRTTRKYNPNKPECGVGSTCYIVQKINDKLDAIWIVTIIP